MIRERNSGYVLNHSFDYWFPPFLGRKLKSFLRLNCAKSTGSFCILSSAPPSSSLSAITKKRKEKEEYAKNSSENRTINNCLSFIIIIIIMTVWNCFENIKEKPSALDKCQRVFFSFCLLRRFKRIFLSFPSFNRVPHSLRIFSFILSFVYHTIESKIT